MKKYYTIISLIVVFLCIVFTACSGKNNESTSSSSSEPTQTTAPQSSASEESKSAISQEDIPTISVSPSLADVEAAVAKALGSGYLCNSEFTLKDLKDYYGMKLDPERIEELLVRKYLAPESTSADVLILLKAKDGYATSAAEIMARSYSSTREYSQTYNIDIQKIDEARLYVLGDYVIYAIVGASGKDLSGEEAAKLAISEYAKFDAAIKEVFGTVSDNFLKK